MRPVVEAGRKRRRLSAVFAGPAQQLPAAADVASGAVGAVGIAAAASAAAVAREEEEEEEEEEESANAESDVEAVAEAEAEAFPSPSRQRRAPRGKGKRRREELEKEQEKEEEQQQVGPPGSAGWEEEQAGRAAAAAAARSGRGITAAPPAAAAGAGAATLRRRGGGGGGHQKRATRVPQAAAETEEVMVVDEEEEEEEEAGAAPPLAPHSSREYEPSASQDSWRATPGTVTDGIAARVATMRARRGELPKVRAAVLFSHSLADDVVAHQKKILGTLGGRTTGRASECTHFVTKGFARTANMLEAVARGCHVVTPRWLEACRQEAKILEPARFLLRDRTKEKEMGFSLRHAVEKAREAPIFEGWRVHITPHTVPPQEALASIAEAAGAEVVAAYTPPGPGEGVHNPCVVLSSEADRALCRSLIARRAPIYSPEFLMFAILRHNISLTESAILFPSMSPRRSTTSW
eukprot:jgi/Mesen1/10377/ME000081S09767